MNNTLALAASVACGTGKNLISKKGGEAFRGVKNSSAVNLVTSVIAVAITAIFALSSSGKIAVAVSAKTFAFAAAFAVFTFSAQACFIRATECGEVSAASLLYAYGFLLPTIFGTIFYREKIGALRIIGIVLVAASAFISNAGGKKASDETNPERGKNRRTEFIVFAVAASLSSGGVGIVQKVFRCSEFSDYSEFFLILAFSFLAVLSASTFAICVIREKIRRRNLPESPCTDDKNTAVPHEKKAGIAYFLVCSSVLGVFVGVANNLNLYLSGALKSAVTFPVTNGGTIALSAVGSALFFREKLGFNKVAGIILGIVAIVLIARGG